MNKVDRNRYKEYHSGGREIAAELAVKYRTQYPRRSAMIDELKRF